MTVLASTPQSTERGSSRERARATETPDHCPDVSENHVDVESQGCVDGNITQTSTPNFPVETAIGAPDPSATWEDLQAALNPVGMAVKLKENTLEKKDRGKIAANGDVAMETEKGRGHRVLAFLDPSRVRAETGNETWDTSNPVTTIQEDQATPESAAFPQSTTRMEKLKILYLSDEEEAIPQNNIMNQPPRHTAEQLKDIAELDAISQAIANSEVVPDGLPGAYSAVPGHNPRRRNCAPTQSLMEDAIYQDEARGLFTSSVRAGVAHIPSPQSARMPPSAHLAVANIVSERNDDLPVAEAMEANGKNVQVEKALFRNTKLLLAVALAAILGALFVVVFVIQQKEKNTAILAPSVSPTTSPAPTISWSPTTSPSTSPSMSPEGYVWSMLPNYTQKSIEDEKSAQFLAYEFVHKDPSLWNHSEPIILQRFALATFYHATGGPTWTYHKDWLSYEVPECNWYVRQTYQPPSAATDSIPSPPCSLQMEFERLWHWASKMTGTLPPELFLLTSLRSINLQKQSLLTGSVPSEIGRCSHLERLTLSDNPFSSLATEMGRLTAMKEFALATGALAGAIPSQFGLMKSLGSLDLSKNFIQEIPSELGQLNKLSSLILSTNLIYGSIPAEFADMAALNTLHLSENSITGPLPSELGKLENLTSLLLFSNSLTGTIPTELAALSKLEQLHIYGNYLTGTLPTAVCNLPHLSRPKVDCGQVACPPSCNCDCRDQAHKASAPSDTMVGGTTTAPVGDSETILVGGSTAAPTGDDSAEMDFPNNGTEGLYSSFPEYDSLPFYTQQALQDPSSPQSKAAEWLLAHPLYATGPEWREHQLFALATFYYSYDGDDWHDDDRENWLNYTVEECSWSGNVCRADGAITELSLHNQSDLLSGTTPPELAMLNSLEALDVIDMELSTILDYILPSQLTALANFSRAHLNSNSLSGSLPSFIGGFGQLTSLQLHRQWFTGTLPTELGLLENLRFLTLHKNFFTGELPSELGLLTSLQSLSLYATDMTGTVPNEICALPALSSLQVSCERVTCPPSCPCTCSYEL